MLAKIHRLDLLPQLYDEVLIPAAVLEELAVRRGREVKQVRDLLRRRQLQLRTVSKRMLKGIPAELGAGELEALALAVKSEADLVILDDRRGRRIAREKGLAVTGTIGVLIEAREKKLIPSVRSRIGSPDRVWNLAE